MIEVEAVSVSASVVQSHTQALSTVIVVMLCDVVQELPCGQCKSLYLAATLIYLSFTCRARAAVMLRRRVFRIETHSRVQVSSRLQEM